MDSVIIFGKVASAMTHSFVSSYYHCVLCTNKKEFWITPKIEKPLYHFLSGIPNQSRSKLIAIGGIENHIHILLSLSASISISEMMKQMKGSSSRWIHASHPDMRHFYWQTGYGAFSLHVNQAKVVKEYILNQKNHHKDISFEEEYKRILLKHGFDPEDDPWI